MMDLAKDLSMSDNCLNCKTSMPAWDCWEARRDGDAEDLVGFEVSCGPLDSKGDPSLKLLIDDDFINYIHE
jgi:hypothetical protein